MSYHQPHLIVKKFMLRSRLDTTAIRLGYKGSGSENAAPLIRRFLAIHQLITAYPPRALALRRHVRSRGDVTLLIR